MKLMLFFGVALTVVIAVSFCLYWMATSALVRDQNPSFANMWAHYHFVAAHNTAFAALPSQPSTSPTAPEIISPFAENSIDQDFRKELESITNRIRNKQCDVEFIANPNKLQDIYYSNFDPSPDRAARLEKKATEDWKNFETDLAAFSRHDPDFQPDRDAFYTSRFDEDGKYQYFEEVRMDKGSGCVTCHGSFVHGELMGVYHAVIPESSMKIILRRYWAYMLGAAIVSMFLALVAVNTLIRWFVIKPLRSLRDVAESISRGEISKRAEIRTGDEFEVLAEAFNRMLRHLVNTQDMLRKANFELESKVDELAHLTIQLYETNRVKSDFMATMSHELRTPLNSILGFSDVLGSIATLNDKQKRYVENINKSGRSLLTMINDILDMAKMEAGRMDVRTAEFHIAAIVAAQVDMAKPLVDRKNIDLETILEPDLPPVKQDESRIQQILNNLLSNAIKFTPEGGRIRVMVQYLPTVPRPASVASIAGAALHQPRNRDMLEIKVSDTGVGISEEDQQIIFEKFRQGKSTMTEGDAMKREHSGSGLGLSIVKEICKMLEGEIAVESRLGIGSMFTVRLPWRLESKARLGSEMMVEIQQFAQNRVKKEP